MKVTINTNSKLAKFVKDQAENTIALPKAEAMEVVEKIMEIFKEA